MHAASRLEAEIREQAETLAARTAGGWALAERAAALLRRPDVAHVVIAARGSSDNAARYAQYLLGETTGLVASLAAPWLYGGSAPLRLRDAAAVAISQSGRSPDIVAVLEVARAQGRPTVAVTNDPGSPLAAAAAVVVPLHAGEERSVAATKTYLASLHALAQIAACLSRDAEAAAWFDRLPGRVAAMADRELSERERFDVLHGAAQITAVGRGLQYPTACETALKLRELGAVGAEAFSLPDLMHGPIAGVLRSGAVWLISTRAREQPDAAALGTLREATGTLVAVSDDPQLTARADLGILIEADVPQWAAPLLAVIPAQAAALRLGELRGVDVDRPAGLRKVTLTR